MKPHRATLILVFGILGFFVCGLFGTAAWIMGNSDIKEMDAGIMDPTGRSTTNAGRICGMIATILMIVALLAVIALFALGILGAAVTSTR